MSKSTVFEVKTDLPIKQFDDLANKLLGFEARYSRIKKQVQLLLQADELEQWSKQKHGKKAVIDLLVDQYPLAIFHGDVGTGKTANAEAIVNRLARDARIEDALLFKLSNKVRGTGKVGEMGTLISQAFDEITRSIGSGNGRAFLIIDEGDSLGASEAKKIAIMKIKWVLIL
jgi:SpoVK/Ycf46/Vps4 family AAA+-type ATPase